MGTPIILIGPGGFTLPELYSDVIAHVANEGYSIQALRLPSVGYKTNVPGTMQNDAAFIASEILKQADEGKDVVLIAHSYGGLPATESTKGLSKADRQRQGKSGGLVRLAYIRTLFSQSGNLMPVLLCRMICFLELLHSRLGLMFCPAFYNSCVLSKTNKNYRMMDGYIRPMSQLLFLMFSTTYRKKLPKSGQR